jgi:Recombination endonuclease VII
LGLSYSMSTIYKNKSSESAALWNKNHPDRAKINRQNWAANNPVKNLELKRAYYWKYRDRIRAQNNSEYATKGKNGQLKASYGIDLSAYNQMLQIQKDCCALCQRHKSKFKYSLHVDHDHTTGRIRGLLCARCNTDLVPLENPIWKLAAEKYLASSSRDDIEGRRQSIQGQRRKSL